ncbi:hypothetical protein TPHA_0H00660 [Tetrapisispora phaffii CBS 4417]|uniref:Uncharacterized protein n=1 Tax=Tetrapisispora phaffii (strain ATCC 24235 / CBS 4417 / NBRC 1672 / NRRL Y-8282 / UCD 70-5) TaxID=1071381 RepID=G8BWX2_TETPH|nr:hypothetical protein TPHA_0H00660 [Tetrapisispora phaffii CBS 4417]CCE64276.1 hypothetical protein TPHA_0H00660 [Tetrapisispora phaffii CBS 4417]
MVNNEDSKKDTGVPHSNIAGDNQSNSMNNEKLSRRTHRIIFKPLSVDDNMITNNNVQCLNIPDGNKIKKVYIPTNLKDPHEIARIFNAAVSVNKSGTGKTTMTTTTRTIANQQESAPITSTTIVELDQRNNEAVAEVKIDGINIVEEGLENAQQQQQTGATGLNKNKQEPVEKHKVEPTVSKKKLLDSRVLNSTKPPNKPFCTMTMEERVERLNSTVGEDQIPLPAINIFHLKELEVNEIIKNAQLRHDIVFDPNLQFRPNLDGNIGVKKRELSQLYWNDLENEIIIYRNDISLFNLKKSRLYPLFDNIRKIMMTIVTPNDYQMVKDVLNPEMNVQNLIRDTLDVNNLSSWIYDILKKYCAPMRDSLVEKLNTAFEKAIELKSLHEFIGCIALFLEIMELMRLDMANHQIRLIRPALISNSIEFERQYNQTILSKPNNIYVSSFHWFKKTYDEEVSNGNLIVGQTLPRQIYRLVIKDILNLTSCSNMVDEFPIILSTDKALLLSLRSKIRQIVCLMICKLLFDQLVMHHEAVRIDNKLKTFIKSSYSNEEMIADIIAIIKDESGNFKWTRNTSAVSLHLYYKIQQLINRYNIEQNEPGENRQESKTSTPAFVNLAEENIAFAKQWLAKQIQSNTPVYQLLEKRVYKIIENVIYNISDCTLGGEINQSYMKVFNKNEKKIDLKTLISLSKSSHYNNNANNEDENNNTLFLLSDEQKFLPISLKHFENEILLATTLINFHWSVVGYHYVQFLGNNISK